MMANVGVQPRGPQGLVGWSDFLVAGGSGNVLRFNMPGEIIQDSLPTSALQLPIVLRLRLKRLPHKDSVGAFGELNLDVPTVSQPVFDYLLGHDSSVRPLKVEPGAAVFCLHPRRELAALAQIDGPLSRVPVVRGCVPLLDVLRVVPCSPDRIQIGLHEGFDSNFQLGTSFLNVLGSKREG
jgi:hypothetical protein